MLNSNLNVILDKGISRYSLVIATAKRARAIAIENAILKAEDKSVEKPVTVALNDLIEGRYEIVEHKDVLD